MYTLYSNNTTYQVTDKGFVPNPINSDANSPSKEVKTADESEYYEDDYEDEFEDEE